MTPQREDDLPGLLAAGVIAAVYAAIGGRLLRAILWAIS